LHWCDIAHEITIYISCCRIYTVPGTAKSPNDYIRLPETEIIFKPGESSTKVTITIVNDEFLELVENFQVKLKSDDPGVTEVKPDTTTVTITDDDGKLRDYWSRFRMTVKRLRYGRAVTVTVPCPSILIG
jgi:hypothetical protein